MKEFGPSLGQRRAERPADPPSRRAGALLPEPKIPSAQPRPVGGTPQAKRRGGNKDGNAVAHMKQAVASYLPPGKGLSLSLTKNRYSMVTVRRRQDGYAVRAHEMFSGAPPRVWRALARYIAHNDVRASVTLGDFIAANENTIRKQPCRPRKVVLRPEGKHHNLQKIFDRLNRQRFDGALSATITWASRVGYIRPQQKSIKMGSFSLEDRIIRIHPVLDDPRVPEYFLAWIVFHEMLHGKHEAEIVGGKRHYHTKAFVAEEQSYVYFKKSQTWEADNMPRLLRQAACRSLAARAA